MADVAVVVPSYNRPERLRACLRALMAPEAPSGPAFEVVVVDDGSSSPLGPICAEFGGRVHYVRQQNRGPASARNAGVRASGADFVAFTDDDCCPRPGWLAALLAAHRGDPLRLVGGRVENALAENGYAAASQSLLYRPRMLGHWFAIMRPAEACPSGRVGTGLASGGRVARSAIARCRSA